MDINQLVDLKKEASERQAAWYRQLLTLASGALAILAGLSPDAQPGVEKYFLAATWLFLGSGIVAGALATYLEVDLSRRLANTFREELQKTLEAGQTTLPNLPIVANPGRVYSLSKPGMVISLLLAVICLVGYSILRTVGA